MNAQVIRDRTQTFRSALREVDPGFEALLLTILRVCPKRDLNVRGWQPGSHVNSLMSLLRSLLLEQRLFVEIVSHVIHWSLTPQIIKMVGCQS